jgi:hypothetical protein
MPIGASIQTRDVAPISAAGSIRTGWLPESLGVIEAPDKPMPIGMASAIGRTEGGLAVWSLNADGADVPGRWVIIDRRSVPAESEGA